MPAPSGGTRNAGQPVHSVLAGWIGSLASSSRQEREAARLALVSVGRPAIPLLMDCLEDKVERVRWEAAKALADLEDAALAPTLVKLLEDPESSIRWIAAEGLVALEGDALGPLLAALEKNAHSQRLREGAHHVIHELQMWKLVCLLTPVMRALEQPAADLAVPPAASAMLDSLGELEFPRRPHRHAA